MAVRVSPAVVHGEVLVDVALGRLGRRRTVFGVEAQGPAATACLVGSAFARHAACRLVQLLHRRQRVTAVALATILGARDAPALLGTVRDAVGVADFAEVRTNLAV